MVTFYFDTSAIVKRYRKEIGSEILDKIFEVEEHGLAVSFWTILEFTVAFSARMRRKKLSRHVFNTAISRFLKDVLDTFAITSVNDELIASATPLAIKHNLPSADCLQLASALNLSARNPLSYSFCLSSSGVNTLFLRAGILMKCSLFLVNRTSERVTKQDAAMAWSWYSIGYPSVIK